MAENQDRLPFKFTPKDSFLGSYYLDYEQEKDDNRTFSVATCQIHEDTWKWFGDALAPFNDEYMRFRKGVKRMTPLQQKEAERPIFEAVKKALLDRKAARYKEAVEKNLEYAKQNKPQRAKGYSAITINMYVRSMSTWFRWLANKGILYNISLNSKKPETYWGNDFSTLEMEESKERRAFFLPVDYEKFLAFRPSSKSFNQQRAWTGGLTLFDLGLRIAELLDLRLLDFDWNNMMVTVNHGKGDQERSVTMSPALQGHLLKYKSRYLNPLLETTPNPHFFGVRYGIKHGVGARMLDDNFRRDLAVVLRKAGIQKGDEEKRLTPHSFRHTAATVGLIESGNVYAVKEKLGHHNIETTLGYLHNVQKLIGEGGIALSGLGEASKYRQLAKRGR